ncbi:MAG: hypothetical protein ACI9IJ_002260, partial [Psychromonas sp.]
MFENLCFITYTKSIKFMITCLKGKTDAYKGVRI